MAKAYILLFPVDWKKPTPTALAIVLGTVCRYTHAAIWYDGLIWDASESRGNFGLLDPDLFKDRYCCAYEVQVDAEQANKWLESMAGSRYDWLGVLLWVFGYRGNDALAYCFKAALRFLYYAAKMRNAPIESRVSGCDLSAILVKSPIVSGRFGEMAARF